MLNWKKGVNAVLFSRWCYSAMLQCSCPHVHLWREIDGCMCSSVKRDTAASLSAQRAVAMVTTQVLWYSLAQSGKNPQFHSTNFFHFLADRKSCCQNKTIMSEKDCWKSWPIYLFSQLCSIMVSAFLPIFRAPVIMSLGQFVYRAKALFSVCQSVCLFASIVTFYWLAQIFLCFFFISLCRLGIVAGGAI